MFSSTEQDEERKTTLKMKPHQVRKPFLGKSELQTRPMDLPVSFHFFDNLKVDNVDDAILPLQNPKVTPQLGFIEPFCCALISLILSAEHVRV